MNKNIKTYIAFVLAFILTSTFVFAETYTVKKGDTLWKIATKLGVDIEEIVDTNDIKNPNLIHPGDLLTIPGSDDTANNTISTNTNSTPTNQLSQKPKYVFYFIGDGLGSSQRELTEMFLREKEGNTNANLVMNQFEVSGVNSTYCEDTLITDSAAAGTALACGSKTNKGVIAKNSSGNDLVTLIEQAEANNISTGIITTTRITHATPAVFASHNTDRDDENGIAADYVDSGVDFFAGGGARHFVPQNFEKVADAAGETIKSKRTDDRDLMNEFKNLGYEVFYGVYGAKKFKTTDYTKVDKVFAPLTYSHMPYEIDRVNFYPDLPSIADMTRAGIDVLSKDKDGFFMMIEGGRIDHACHANDAAGTVYDVLAFDEAVKEAYDFYKKHPKETLIVVVGDHETGGLGLGFDAQGYFIELQPLYEAKTTIADKLIEEEYTYQANGDRDAYIKLIGEKLGLTNLTDEEMSLLKEGMDLTDKGIGTGYYEYNSAALAVTQIVARRMNINWTTTIHTGACIPFTAQGVGAQQFDGYIDNTDIALTIADILGFKLSK